MTPSPPAYERHPGFTRIRIGGGAFERGFQHGRLLRAEIRSLRRVFYDEVVYLHGFLLGCVLQIIMATFLLFMLRHIPAELKREMRGVARGAGVPFWDILIFNCFDDVLHALWVIPGLLARVPFIGNRFACSSFAVLAANTVSGRLVHGRNFDYEVANGYLAGDGAVTRALKEYLVVIDCRPNDGYPYVSVGWPGVVGVVTGLNAAGLSLACLTSVLAGETAHGVPMPLIYRQIVQYCSTLEQSDLLLRASRRTIGNNLLVASDAEGDARVFELAPQFVHTRAPHEGVLVTTNHYLHERTSPHQEGWLMQGSIDRHTRLEALCRAGVRSAEQATDFLRDSVSLHPDGDRWSCLENPGTIYSSVTEPASGRIWLRPNDQPEREFVCLQADWATSQVPAGAA